MKGPGMMKNYLAKNRPEATIPPGDGEPAKKRVRRSDRISLSSDSIKRIDGWLSQIAPRLKGVKLSRTDIVNWLVQVQADELSEQLQADIEKRYFDPVKALEWAAKMAKSAKGEGDDFDLRDFVEKNIFAKRSTAKRRKPKSMTDPKPSAEKQVDASPIEGGGRENEGKQTKEKSHENC